MGVGGTAGDAIIAISGAGVAEALPSAAQASLAPLFAAAIVCMRFLALFTRARDCILVAAAALASSS